MVGVDLVFIPEFKRQLELGGKAFLEKAFSAAERADQDVVHLAGIWAAKEAVFKASSGTKTADHLSVIIRSGIHGKPSAEYDGVRYAVSISHHHEYAVAIALRSA